MRPAGAQMNMTHNATELAMILKGHVVIRAGDTVNAAVYVIDKVLEPRH